jgi:hypothetical protein
MISVLDPGGYGAVTITKSITIDGGGIEASILSPSTTGITVNITTVGDPGLVVLRNLSINGGPVNASGINGIRFLSGTELHDETVQIFNNRVTTAGTGWGILVNPTTAGVRRLYVSDSSIHTNGGITTGGGISLAPTGTGYVYAVITGTNISGNAGHGVRLGANSFATISGSNISDNRKSGVYVVVPGTTAWAEAVVRSSTLSDSGWDTGNAALHADGVNAYVRISDNVIANNELGVLRSNGGNIRTQGDNQAVNNSSNGTPNAALDTGF